MTDTAFIARFLPQYPEWRERPGAADGATIVELARKLQLASRGETLRDYDRVRAEHLAGHGVLVQTERVPEQIEPAPLARRYWACLEKMDSDSGRFDGFFRCLFFEGHR